MTKKEEVDVQDAEAGIHAEVQGTGREAGEITDDDRGSFPGTRISRADAAQLSQGGWPREAESVARPTLHRHNQLVHLSFEI
jgi:hypothetical protein